MLKYSFVLICFLMSSVFISSQGFSQNRGVGHYLKCNKSQEICYVDSSRLTVGDKVGFFTEYGHLVATGTVESVKKNKKEVKLDQKFSRIRHSHRIRTLTDAQYELLDYPRFRDNKKMKAGLGLGLGELSTTGTMKAGLLALHFDYAYGVHGFAWTGRLNTYYGTREKGFSPSAGKECIGCPKEHALFSMSVLLGASYQTPRNYPVSLRVEGNIGGGYTSSKIGGELAQDVSDFFESEVDNGFHYEFGVRLSALYNMDIWQPEVAIQASRLAGTVGWFATLGAVYAIE